LAVVTTAEWTSPKSVALQETANAADVVSMAEATQTPDGLGVRMAEELGAEPSEDPSTITTGSEHSTYQLGGSELTVAPRSRVQYRGSDAEGWLVVVEDGSVRCEVTPRQGRPDFVVHVGTVEVRVVGTRFEVAYIEGQASVAVVEGEVLVLDGGRRTELTAGQEWSTTKPSHASSDRDLTRKPSPSSTSAREDYELAASLESSEPSRALSIYRRLSQSGGPWAANALYARARLLKEGGRNAEAHELLNRYLKLYPRGTNSADARRLLKHQH
jgi:hypothetical protein